MRWAGLAALVALGASGFVVTKLPRPRFPAPVASARAPTHMRIVSSRLRPPAIEEHGIDVYAGLPRSFRGAPLVRGILRPTRTLLLYGQDGASARYLLAFDGAGHFRYGFDFANFAWPPRLRPGEREFVHEEIVWAREASGLLYVENAHDTYARSSFGRNGYITAIDLHTRKALWRSPALVANAKTFAVTSRYLVTGYGFTDEPDYLYLLDRPTGRVRERLKLPTAPDRITRSGKRIHVRTYDHDLVVQLNGV
jgi:hypothetical protein